MRYQLKRMLSATLAVALLGFTVMLSVSAAKGPYRRAGENAFDGPPPGYPDKALISAAWIDDITESFATDEPPFDWGLECAHGCPNCGFKDAQVMPVVLDMPELVGGSDEAAVEVIKRKLGINPFRGSIFEGLQAPAAQLLTHDAPAELKTLDCVLQKLTPAGLFTATCGVECLNAQAGVCTAGPGGCTEACTAGCKTGAATAQSACSDSALAPVATTAEIVEPYAGLALPEPSDRLDLLRQVSPGLDELANKLEDADLFAEADAVREAAQRLRLKARELKTGATAAIGHSPWRPVSTTTASCDCCKNQCGSECKCSKAASAGEQSTSTEIDGDGQAFRLLRTTGEPFNP